MKNIRGLMKQVPFIPLWLICRSYSPNRNKCTGNKCTNTTNKYTRRASTQGFFSKISFGGFENSESTITGFSKNILLMYLEFQHATGSSFNALPKIVGSPDIEM